MLALYLICSLAGGGLVLLMLLGGDGDASADGLDVGDTGGGSAGDLLLVRGALEKAKPKWWAPLSTFRFWVFFSAFFGWTGLALHWLTNLAPATVTTLAACMGTFAAVLMAFSLSFVRRAELDSGVRGHELPGSEGVVLLPVSASRAGKVRVRIGNREIDYTAVLDGAGELARGQQVIVLHEEGGRLRVTSAQTLLPGDWPDLSDVAAQTPTKQNETDNEAQSYASETLKSDEATPENAASDKVEAEYDASETSRRHS